MIINLSPAAIVEVIGMPGATLLDIHKHGDEWSFVLDTEDDGFVDCPHCGEPGQGDYRCLDCGELIDTI